MKPRTMLGLALAAALVLAGANGLAATLDVSPAQNITNTGDTSGSGYYERDPELLISSGGTWYLVYSRSQASFAPGGNPDGLKYDIYYQTSTDNGTTWSAAAKILNAAAISANANFRSGAVCEADGKIWIIGANSENSEGDIYANTYSGGAWSGQTMIFNGTFATGAFHVDAVTEGDDIRLFYGIQTEANGVGFIKYHGDTDTWDGTVTQIGASAGYQIPRVIKEGGTYYLVSTDWSNILFTSTTTPDVTPWPAATAITTAPSGGASSDPCILKYGGSGGTADLVVFHAPWYPDDSQPQEYVYSADGGTTWSSSKAFTDGLHGTQKSWDMMPRAYMKDANTIMSFFGMEQRGVDRGQGDIVMVKWDISATMGNTHYTSIQDGIDNAASGDRLDVADGTYGADPVTGKCAYVTKDGLSLIGESETGTIIDGAIGGVGSSGAYWPAGIHVQANNVTVRNFTIQGFMGDQINTGGYGIVHRDWSHDTPGEGYIFYDGCTVDSLTVKDSYSAIYALCFTHLTVSNCTVTDNEADGMFIARGCDYATITDNFVTNSGDHGIWVGICWMGLRPSDHAVIRNNRVDGAEEGGISFVKSVDALIEGNTITNVAGVAPDEGWSRGALSLKDGCANVVARYNVIYDNDGNWNGYSGTGNGIGIDGTPSNIVLQHNTIYGNTGYGCYNYSTVDVDAKYCWWGDATGPSGVGGGTGDEVSAHVAFDPWVGKLGGENIVCDPDPEYLTNASPSKTIAVKYLGGGGGLMYSYSLKFSWNASVVTTATAEVTEGDLLKSRGTTQFFKMKSGNEMRVDCALLGGQPGVTGPGTLFTVEFTGAGCGTSPVDITLFYVRDNLNNNLAGFYEDDGSIVVDMTNPVFTINGPWPDGQCYNAAPVMDLGASDACGDLDDAFYRVGAGAWQADAGLFTDYSGASWTNATWTLPGFAGLGEGSHTVGFYCTDDIGNSSSVASWTFIKDTVDPGPVTGFTASPGLKKVHLSWTNPGSDFDHVVVVRKAWDAGSPYGYPEYVQPAVGYPTGPGDGVAIYTGTGTSYDDPFTLDDRSIYFYRAFAYDCADNYNGGTAPGGAIPPAFAQGDRATNYWLGDASKSGGGGYDGYVDYFDIVALSAGYWLYSPASPPIAPHNECDVGPTDDHGRLGLPLPDDYIDFEDLMIFAMNYSVVNPSGYPTLPGVAVGGPLALRLEADGTAAVGEEMVVHLVLDGNRQEVKGVSVVLGYEPGCLQLVGTTAASAFTDAGERVFFTSKETEPGTLWMDLAVLGTDRAINGSGQLAELTFKVRAESQSPLRFAQVSLRGIDNKSVSAESKDLTLDVKAGLPEVTCLIGAQPNPLNPGTAIRYDLKGAGMVELLVYDARGRLVRTLVDEEQPAGRYSQVWNGLDAQGRDVPCGVYFVKMQVAGYTSTVKLVKVN